LDILYPEITGSDDYTSLPDNAIDFISKIEKEVGLPITLIGTGPGVKELIDRR
jgi:adenylosuccinate synthase